MAVEEINKPKTEKTSASVTSTLPRLCPTTKIYSKDTGYDKERVKSLSPRSRPTSNDIKKRPGFVDFPKINLHESILTEFRNSEQVRFKNNSLTFISPRDCRSLIPIPKRNSLNSVGMSPPITRSSSPLKKSSPKDKSSNKIKTITLDQDVKKKTLTGSSRSQSPLKKTTGSYKKTKPRATSPGALKNLEKTAIIKRSEGPKQGISPRTNSPSKRKLKTKVSSSSNVEFLAKEKLMKKTERLEGEVDAIILKQASQPSLCKKELVITPKEKISLDHLKNEVYSGDHKRLSYEKVQLCIEKSLENITLAESKRRYLVTYSAENLKNQKEISLAFVENISSKSITNMTSDYKNQQDATIPESRDAIRTLSGEELILSPSIIKLEKADLGYDDLEISNLLCESGKNEEEHKEIHIIQDDANEYDSEISTDGEIPELKDEASKKSAHSLWKKREVELLNDVDYRQSVYHPAVSRRQEMENLDFRPDVKSMEDDYESSGKEKNNRNRSTHLKSKFPSQNYSTSDDEDCKNGSWCTGFDNSVSVPIYNSVMQDVPLYGSITGVERIRTKKQRFSGAMLRFTLKIIRLLALFNLWPGDFCHMLTSQSLRLAR